MDKRIGILTAGGDCPGLNATIRGAAKALYQRMGSNVQIVGIRNGFSGLIHGDYMEMSEPDFSDLLTRGGTILGTMRTPFSKMRIIEEDGINKIQNMCNNYQKMNLDALLCLGGNGTHKTAHLLMAEGLNVITLPKTIDNDIWGTDVCFGFHTAVEIATDVIDRIHTTASSHRRVMLIELMGNKAGWLTLYSGIAGGADIILIPERPYNISNVVAALEKRASAGKSFSIIAMAEGCYDLAESKLKRKDWRALRAEYGYPNATERLAHDIELATSFETRIAVPGHIQRGGTPCAYDRVLATQFGTYAAKLIADKHFGVAVAKHNGKTTSNPLETVAGKTRLVTEDCVLITVAKEMGLSLG